MTAASCIEGANSVSVLSGAHNLENENEQVHWQRANAQLPGQFPPGYSPGSHEFDAVLLDIDVPFTFDSESRD